MRLFELSSLHLHDSSLYSQAASIFAISETSSHNGS